MKKISILLGTILFFGALQASALEVGVSNDLKVGVGNENANSNLKTEVKVTATSSKGDEHSSSTVSASAKEIRGWSDGDKKQFLTTVKTQAQLKSGQDLDNFAKGVMLKDENVTDVNAGDDHVEVSYKLPAKFLGLFSSEISAITNVTFETSKRGRGPKDVTVKFPWYKRFFSLDSSVREDIIKAAVDESVQTYAQTPRDNAFAQNGVTIELISSILKGIRAEISATTSVSVK